MKYDWENTVIEADILEATDGLVDGDLEVIGLVVRNTESVEAAIITRNPSSLGDIADADIWQDVLGGAQRKYREARRVMDGNTRAIAMAQLGHGE